MYILLLLQWNEYCRRKGCCLSCMTDNFKRLARVYCVVPNWKYVTCFQNYRSCILYSKVWYKSESKRMWHVFKIRSDRKSIVQYIKIDFATKNSKFDLFIRLWQNVWWTALFICIESFHNFVYIFRNARYMGMQFGCKMQHLDCATK